MVNIIYLGTFSTGPKQFLLITSQVVGDIQMNWVCLRPPVHVHCCSMLLGEAFSIWEAPATVVSLMLVSALYPCVQLIAYPQQQSQPFQTNIGLCYSDHAMLTLTWSGKPGFRFLRTLCASVTFDRGSVFTRIWWSSCERKAGRRMNGVPLLV